MAVGNDRGFRGVEEGGRVVSAEGEGVDVGGVRAFGWVCQEGEHFS